MIKKSVFIINLFFIILLVCSLEPSTSGFISSDIRNILKLFDESYILFIFLYSLKYKPTKTLKQIYIYLGVYFCAGMIGGILRNAPISILLQGFLLSAKGLILLTSLIRIPFVIDDFKRLATYLEKFIYVVIIFAIIDFISGVQLKDFLQLRQISRGGIYVLNSLFVQPSDLAGFMFIGGFYFLKFRRNKFLTMVANIIGLLTFNVKEIFGNFVALVINYKNDMYKKIISIKNIILFVLSISVIFYAYAKILPQHFNNYFVETDGIARVMLYRTGFQIAQDDFPIGEGFGRYGGYISSEYYSPVYAKYNLDEMYGLQNSKDRDSENFIQDTFWPMILGESGLIGLILYVIILFKGFAPLFQRDYNNIAIDDMLSFGRYLVVFAIIASVAKPYFTSPPAYFWLFGITGIIISIVNQSNKNAEIVTIDS